MKNPSETIDRMRAFSRKIKKEEWRANFVLQEGYFKFIEDLYREADFLKESCLEILFKAERSLELERDMEFGK